jgi:hypothetical protein
MGENVVGTYYYPPSAAAMDGVELGHAAAGSKLFDDDGRPRRNGKRMHAAHGVRD